MFTGHIHDSQSSAHIHGTIAACRVPLSILSSILLLTTGGAMVLVLVPITESVPHIQQWQYNVVVV